MKERFIKVNGTYYPIDSVLFHIDKVDTAVYIYQIGDVGNTKRVPEIIVGKQASELIALLNELSFEITGEDDSNA